MTACRGVQNGGYESISGDASRRIPDDGASKLESRDV